MRYYKRIKDSYITLVGTGCGDTEITKEEYDMLVSVINAKPTPPEGYDYRLREDLTWEEYQLPIIDPAEEEIDDSEALAIILGGEV